MPSLLKNGVLAILALGLVLALLALVWPLLAGRGTDSAQAEFASLLPPGQTFAGSTPALDTGDPTVKQWVIFYRRADKKCLYGVVYRSQVFRADRAQVLLPWQLADAGGSDICLGTTSCKVQARDILQNYGGPVELAIWGYTGSDWPTRLNLFYCPDFPGPAAIGDLRYVHYRTFEGDRGIRFDSDHTTLIVKKTVRVGQDALVRSALSQVEVFEQQSGVYPEFPTRSTVRFQSEKIPTDYPAQPEEVVVAFCLQYADEGARKRYLDENANVQLTPPGGFGCMGPAAPVDVLLFLAPPEQIGNSATVRLKVLVAGQVKDTTWSLRYAEGPTGQGSERQWRWRIVNCTNP